MYCCFLSEDSSRSVNIQRVIENRESFVQLFHSCQDLSVVHIYNVLTETRTRDEQLSRAFQSLNNRVSYQRRIRTSTQHGIASISVTVFLSWSQTLKRASLITLECGQTSFVQEANIAEDNVTYFLIPYFPTTGRNVSVFSISKTNFRIPLNYAFSR